MQTDAKLTMGAKKKVIFDGDELIKMALPIDNNEDMTPKINQNVILEDYYEEKELD